MSAGFSIVVPAFNSEESLQELTEKVLTALPPQDVEIIIVDDGSRPATWEKIKEIKNRYGDNVKGIRLGKNFGQHNATLCGIRYSSKSFVATIDDDLQFNPADLLLLYAELCKDHSDLAYGIPIVKKQSLSRRAGYAALKFSAGLFRDKILTASSFRLMKRELAARLKENERYYVNIDVVLSLYTSAVSYVPVVHHKRTTSRSGYTYAGLMNFAIRALFAYSATPFKLFFLFFLFLLSADLYFILYAGTYSIFKLLSMFVFSSSALFFVFVLVYFYHLTGFMSNKPCYHVSEII